MLEVIIIVFVVSLLNIYLFDKVVHRLRCGRYADKWQMTDISQEIVKLRNSMYYVKAIISKDVELSAESKKYLADS